MIEQKYFCICADDSRHETMTKEQILTAIQQAIETGSVSDIDTGCFTKVKDTNRGSYITFWVGTREQYNEVEEDEPNCIYIITNDTTTDEILKALASLRTDVDAAVRKADEYAQMLLVTETAEIDTWDTLNALVESTVKEMLVHSAKIISCRGCGADFGNGATITIIKSVDIFKTANAKVLFEDELEGTVMQRFANSDMVDTDKWYFTEWEYITPPMKEGVEYRTAERHNGKPVYAKTSSVEMGDSGETRSMPITFDATENFQVVSVDAVCKPPSNIYPWSTFPVFSEHDGSIAATCEITVEDIGDGNYQAWVDFHSFVTMTGHIATVTVKYTK